MIQADTMRPTLPPIKHVYCPTSLRNSAVSGDTCSAGMGLKTSKGFVPKEGGVHTNFLLDLAVFRVYDRFQCPVQGFWGFERA